MDICVNNASAADWWRLAGVDTLVGEEPRNWLLPVPSPSVPPQIAAERPILAETLEGLVAGLLDPEKFSSIGSRRIAPSGEISSGLMILTDVADPEDFEVGALLAGKAGTLFDRMLAAIGRDRTSCYLASLCPGRPPTGRIDVALEKDLAEIALRHVMLARPKVVLLMGDAASRALAGTNLPAARGRLLELNDRDETVNAVATFHPRFLLQQPRCKADSWRDLQRLAEAMNR